MPDELVLRFNVKDDGSIVIDKVNKKINETSKEAKGLVPGLEGAPKSLTGFVGDNSALIGVLVGVGLAMNKAIGDTLQYAGEVRDLTLATGGTAEASSRLIQVLGDYEIQQGDITAGMKAMKEKGIVPTIDSIANLSAGFLAIEDPAERLKFAQDALGKSSAKFLNVLSQGPDKLRALNDSISESQILTDEDIQKTEEARLAMDAWGDTVQGLKTEFALGLLPPLTKVINVTGQVKEKYDELSASGERVSLWQARIAVATEGANSEVLTAEEYYGRMADALRSQAIPAMNEYGQIISEVNYESLISGMMDYQTQTDDFNATQDELKQKISDLNGELATLSSQGFGESSKEIQNVKGNIADLSGQLSQSEKDFKLWAAQTVFSFATARAGADGSISTLEGEVLVAAGVGLELFDEKTATVMQNVNSAFNDLDASNAEAVISTLEQSMAALTGQPWVINISTDTSNVHIPGDDNSNCFIAGTLVTMADGTGKAIEEVKVGDEIIICDFDAQKNSIAPVSQIFHHDASQTNYYLLINGVLGVTPEHRTWTPRGWVRAGDLVIGDCLVDLDNNHLPITTIETIGESVPTYNLHVDHPAHNYYANGFLVHNVKAPILPSLLPSVPSLPSSPLNTSAMPHTIVIQNMTVYANNADEFMASLQGEL